MTKEIKTKKELLTILENPNGMKNKRIIIFEMGKVEFGFVDWKYFNANDIMESLSFNKKRFEELKIYLLDSGNTYKSNNGIDENEAEIIGQNIFIEFKSSPNYKQLKKEFDIKNIESYIENIERELVEKSESIKWKTEKLKDLNKVLKDLKKE